MAKINSSSLGSFSGKIGNVVTYITRGKNFVRIYTDSVANPDTEKQAQVRARFGALAKLSSAFISAIDLGYSYRARQRRNMPANNFVTDNWDAVGASSPDDVTVNYSEMHLARGPLTGVVFGTVDWGAGEHLTVEVPFDGNTGAPRTDTADETYLFAYVPDLGQGLLSVAAMRSGDAVSLTVPASWNGMTAHLWGFTVGKGHSTYGKVSESAYLGHGEIQ